MTTTVKMHIYDGVITQEEASITIPDNKIDMFNDPTAHWVWVPEFQDAIDYNIWLDTGIFVLGTNTSFRYRLDIYNTSENTGVNEWTFT